MKRRAILQSLGAASLLSLLEPTLAQSPGAASTAVFELRIYHANDGKLDALLSRFRDHTTHIFARHGITSIAYWLPVDDGPLKNRTLVYILKYPSREEAKIRWKAFQDDPEWIRVKAASEANGKLVDHVDSTFLALTDFSPHL